MPDVAQLTAGQKTIFYPATPDVAQLTAGLDTMTYHFIGIMAYQRKKVK